MGMDGRLTVQQGAGESMAGPAHLDGPFMVVANNVTESNTIDFARPDKRESNVNIGLQVFIEPKVRLLGRSWSPVLEDFVDDAGHSLINEAEQRERRTETIQGHSREPVFQGGMTVPSVKGRTKKIARLKGYFRVAVQTGSGRIELPDLKKAKGTTQSQGGWRLTVNELAENGGGNYTFKFTVVRETPEKVEPGKLPKAQWRDQLSVEAMRLLDADGRELARGGATLSGNNHTWTGEIQYRRGGTPAGPAAKLVWEFPTTSEERKIPFEFKDLPLP
jgi:hypothetical protein